MTNFKKDAEVMRLEAVKEAVREKARENANKLLPELVRLFQPALKEKREPTEPEIISAVETREAEASASGDFASDGQEWYVVNRLLPLVEVLNSVDPKKMNKDEYKKARVKALIDHLYDQAIISKLDDDHAAVEISKDLDF